MARKHLTDATVKALTTEKTQEDFWDTTTTGFGVRVTSTGRKSFVLMYRIGRRKRRMTLGRYPQIGLAAAREKARKLLGQAANGKDPQREKLREREAMTFGELWERYEQLEGRRKLSESTLYHDRTMLECHAMPHWRNRRAKSIKRADVFELLDGIVLGGAPSSSRAVRRVVSKLYNWAILRDLVEHNPCHLVPCPVRPVSRDRVLNPSEIRRIWEKFPVLTPVSALIYKIQLLTAQRGKEVRSLRWDQIEGEWWTIPGDVSKNRKSHRVYLAPQVRGLLAQLRSLAGDSPWVFPMARDRSRYRLNPTNATRKLRKLSGVEFVPHDLRRTAASLMAGMGVPRIVISKILNHSDGSVTAIYDRHSYDPEKQEALSRWADRLEEILGDLEDFGQLRVVA